MMKIGGVVGTKKGVEDVRVYFFSYKSIKPFANFRVLMYRLYRCLKWGKSGAKVPVKCLLSAEYPPLEC